MRVPVSPDDLDEQDTEEISQTEIPDFGVAAGTFDELILKNRSWSETGTVDWLNSQLRVKIASVDRLIALSEEQKGKLQLAGRGDISRFVDQVEKQRRKFRDVKDADIDDRIVNEMNREARQLRGIINSGLFEENSLFGKTRQSMLTVGQSRTSVLLSRIEQAGGRIELTDRPPNEVQNLVLSATDFADGDLRHLGELASLKCLVLDATQVTDSGLKHLSGLQNLETLDLGDTRITDRGLIRIQALTSLKSLNLEGTRVTDAGLVTLRSLTNLEVLDLSRTTITDAGVKQLLGLRRLERLHLTGVRVTNSGISQLQGLTSLRRLFLEDTQITDAGLLPLAKLAKLERLDLHGTKTTAAGVEKLEHSLPNLSVFR